jgi:hypothetical protein
VSERLTKALKISSAAASNPSQVRGRKKRGGLAVLFSSVFSSSLGLKDATHGSALAPRRFDASEPKDFVFENKINNKNKK